MGSPKPVVPMANGHGLAQHGHCQRFPMGIFLGQGDFGYKARPIGLKKGPCLAFQPAFFGCITEIAWLLIKVEPLHFLIGG
jgi:hypothetical protein